MPMDVREKFFNRHERRLEAEIRQGVDPRDLDEFELSIIEMLELAGPHARDEVSDQDRLAVEFWRADEQHAKGEASLMQTLVRLGERSPTFMRDILPPTPNGVATMREADLRRLGARLVAQLKLHMRGRAARRRARVSKRRGRDPRRKRR